MNGVERCNQYANDVLSGAIPSCKTIQLACERYRNDFNNEELLFDERSANASVANIERLCHAKGKLQGQHIHLENWQCFKVCNLFGWKWKKNGLRRFRRAYARVPRKNGKSLLAIAIALQMFGPDQEKGAEVYLGATSQEQAKDLLFLPAKYIVEKSTKFTNRFGIEVNANTLVIPENFSVLKSVIRKPDDGSNPHCALVDEYHLHDTNEQYAVFDTGMGAREQPLLIVTTTAGSNLGGPCKEMDDECVKLLEGQFEDDSLFVLIYMPDEGDEWDDPETLMKVNPNIGISVSKDYLLDQQNIARRSAQAQNDFRTKHLNEWVGARTVWMNMLAWRRQQKNRLEEFKYSPLYLAVDLASRKDVAVIAGIYEKGGEFYSFEKYYAPEAAAEENEIYRKFALAGELILTPGNQTDQAFIEEELKDLCRENDVQGIGFDDWQADYMMTRLLDCNLPVVNFNQTVRNMSSPMKELEVLVLDGKFWHTENSCTTWMMGNVVAKVDAKEHIYPRKENDNDKRCKIDGAVALIMATGMTMTNESEAMPSIGIL